MSVFVHMGENRQIQFLNTGDNHSMFNSRHQWGGALSIIGLLGILGIVANNAWAQTCSDNCLHVYSIDLQDLGSSIRGTVKLADETGSAGAARSSVVHGVWTLPDGSAFHQYAIIGTRLRAEFKLYTAGTAGHYTLTVAGVTKAAYTLDPHNSTQLSGSIQIGGAADAPPTAISNADNLGGAVPLTVNFDSIGSAAADGTAVSYVWDFGDGSHSSDAHPSHTYLDVGSFVATLTVTDDKGATASNSIPIVVTNDIAGCSGNCMAVDRIELSYKARTGKVKGKVWLLDENFNPVGDANVHAVWTLPDGTTKDQYRTIGNRMRANFALVAKTAGSYELRVVEVTRTGHTFDPDNSNVLSDVIDIAP